jgi:transcriptional regulator with XRE-family HTH domain
MENITSPQIVAARALVDWTAERLASESGVSVSSIRKFESGQSSKLMAANLAAIVKALEGAGVEFISSPEKLGVSVLRRV